MIRANCNVNAASSSHAGTSVDTCFSGLQPTMVLLLPVAFRRIVALYGIVRRPRHRLLPCTIVPRITGTITAESDPFTNRTHSFSPPSANASQLNTATGSVQRLSPDSGHIILQDRSKGILAHDAASTPPSVRSTPLESHPVRLSSLLHAVHLRFHTQNVRRVQRKPTSISLQHDSSLQ